ncbi:hypothetical protein [Lutibacter sp.]
MSNPAVIILVDTKTTSSGRFKVEDNIGEAIHIHYDNFRIDLTINEFLNFTNVIEESLNNLIDNESFDINNFDPNFLHDISDMLIHLKKVTFETVNLSDLIVSRKGFLDVPKWAGLNESRVYHAIKGDSLENDNYLQNNFFNQSNNDRINSVKKLVKQNGYPYNNEYIVLFNNQNYIRDGQHRASSLLAEKGDLQIPIIRLHFKNNRFNLKHNLWLHSFIPVMKSKTKNLAKKIIARVKILQILKNKLRK